MPGEKDVDVKPAIRGYLNTVSHDTFVGVGTSVNLLPFARFIMFPVCVKAGVRIPRTPYFGNGKTPANSS